MLTPKGNVHFQAAPVHSDLDATRHRILFADPIEYDVYGAHEYLPHTIQAEEMAEHIEVLALERTRPALPLLHVSQIVHL